ncbi:hypothetical protein AVEN_202863-1 [Araneus ventricosus]|uniref:Reverse transcriptase domain-containing protein n=1 Tax=Araneus ventricosus TaxID=182803 RepID=A0A4Y2CCT0_ARAVE|nr:hypothetical protein AVEN_202863-1 [Araneus ventricosus]
MKSLITKIKESKSSAKHSIVLSIDIKGAFVNLNQAILKALTESPCPRNITTVFSNILQNRQVSIQTPTGPIIRNQAKGCPQGSCSSPALWNLVANTALNLPWQDGIHVQAFADDFAMVIKEQLKNVAQNAINEFNLWYMANHLEMAPEKTNYIIFSTLVAPPRLTWNGVTIKKS